MVSNFSKEKAARAFWRATWWVTTVGMAPSLRKNKWQKSLTEQSQLSAFYKANVTTFHCQRKNNSFPQKKSWERGKKNSSCGGGKNREAWVKREETDRTRLRVQNEESKMRGRRRWKGKKRGQEKGKKVDRDKWPWEMAGAGEPAYETGLSAALTQTDRPTSSWATPIHSSPVCFSPHSKENITFQATSSLPAGRCIWAM